MRTQSLASFMIVSTVLLTGGEIRLGVAASAADHAGIIQQRIALMKENGKLLKAIKEGLQGQDLQAVAVAAQRLADNGRKIPTLFPEGSTSPDSRAKPEIWQQWKTFVAAAKAMEQAAAALEEVAATKDAKATFNQFRAVIKACGSCHKPFRAP
ncbi:MAG: c-type cytochrome, partial [Candidatus Methylomirabilales bacterium]